MRPFRRRDVADERGSILVHVAFALLALISFATMVVDYGVFWESRRQAQNSADAGAMGGALALIGDGSFSDTGPAKETAYALARANPVWGQPPALSKTSDIIFGGSPIVPCPATTIVGSICITVRVYRDLAHTNALPVFFGSLVGLASQDVRATATAYIVPANASECLGPIAILDTSPTYTVTGDLGSAMTLSSGSWPGAPGYHGYLTFGGPGGNGVGNALKACMSGMHYVGEDITAWEYSGTASGVQQSVSDLVLLDPSATWDSSSKTIVGSCVSSGTCHKYDSSLNYVSNPTATISPRVIGLPVVDLAIWNATHTLTIVNILGFFVTGTSGAGNDNVDGFLVSQPGLIYSGTGAGTVDPTAAFLKTVVLIR